MGKQLPHHLLVEFPAAGEKLLADHLDPMLYAVGLDDIVQFLNDIKGIHLSGKPFDEIYRQGVDHAKFQIRGVVPHGFLGVLIAGAGGDDPDGGIVHFNPVDLGMFRPLGQFDGPLLYQGVLDFRHSGQHDVLLRIFLIGLELHFLAGAQFHQASGVGDAGGQPQDHGRVKLLGQLIGELGKLLTLGRIGGLQHGDLGADGVIAAVLLVLGGVHAGIIGHSDHHAAVYADIGHGKKGISRYVQSHVLHSRKRTRAGKAGAGRHFHRHFLIGRPFALDLPIFGGGFRDFGTGSAGIAGGHTHAGFI